MIRRVQLVHHVNRPDALEASEIACTELEARGITVLKENDDDGADLVLALGGDGTILYAADIARRQDVPLLGVNMGHMGFLAEVPGTGISAVIDRIARHDFHVDTRMTLDVTMRFPDGTEIHDWALNDAAIMHTDVAHPVALGLVVDGQAVSTYGADGIVLATPTGSTAYSFSAGGPVVWPDTEAVLMAPIAAHGLFTRPLVVGPSSVLEVLILEKLWTAPEVWCDGLRRTTVPYGTSVVTRVGKWPVRLVRLDDTPFAARLVSKFDLPVRGWRTEWREAGLQAPPAGETDPDQ